MGAPFLTSNQSLVQLPQGVVASAEQVRAHLETIERSELPLADKLRLVEQQQLTPFVTGSKVRGPFSLLIDIEERLRYLDIVRLRVPIEGDRCNGDLDRDLFDGETLVRVPNPHLIYSVHEIVRHATSPEAAEMAGQLFSLGRRLTRYRGTTVSWDHGIDRGVWTTNVDTVVLLDRLFQSGLLRDPEIRRVMEVGVGGGAIAKTLLRATPNLVELIVTDISPYALLCAQRNIGPVLSPHQSLHLYLGKGVRNLNAGVDLMVVNPPYIPQLGQASPEDPYRGTGLLREIVERGATLLNPNNPDASICMILSNLADRDLHAAIQTFPGFTVQRLGAPFDAPLKILAVNENRDWIEFLIREHGLRTAPPPGVEGRFPFWHSISTWILRRR